jgi:hypothetical protein
LSGICHDLLLDALGQKVLDIIGSQVDEDSHVAIVNSTRTMALIRVSLMDYAEHSELDFRKDYRVTCSADCSLARLDKRLISALCKANAADTTPHRMDLQEVADMLGDILEDCLVVWNSTHKVSFVAGTVIGWLLWDSEALK